MAGVRESCGYLTGILLHRDLGEEPCSICKVAAERWAPLQPTSREQQQRRAELADATSRKWEPHKEYGFPSID